MALKRVRIDSTRNPHVLEALKIGRKRRRFGMDAFLLEGPRMIEAALAAGVSVLKVFHTERFSARPEHRKLLRELSARARDVFEADEKIIKALSDTETPQGITAVASFERKPMEGINLGPSPLVVALDGLQEPGNVGTAIRAADAAGADAVVVLPGSADPFSQKALRASAGSVFNVPVLVMSHGELAVWLGEKSIRMAAAMPRGGESIYEADMTGPLCLAFGNEAGGVSVETKKASDLAIRIPMFGSAESLNVGASVAVALFEARRQRLGKAEKHG